MRARALLSAMRRASALRPVMADVVTGIGQAHRAGISSRREGGAVFEPDAGDHGGSCDRRVMVVVFGVWVALAWQRSEVASLQQEKADLRGEIAAMTEVSQKMQSQGLKIEFQDCKEANGRMRRCVAVQPGMSFFGTEQAPFYVLKGY